MWSGACVALATTAPFTLKVPPDATLKTPSKLIGTALPTAANCDDVRDRITLEPDTCNAPPALIPGADCVGALSASNTANLGVLRGGTENPSLSPAVLEPLV